MHVAGYDLRVREEDWFARHDEEHREEDRHDLREDGPQQVAEEVVGLLTETVGHFKCGLQNIQGDNSGLKQCFVDN